MHKPLALNGLRDEFACRDIQTAGTGRDLDRGGWVFLGVDHVTQMDVICWHERVWVPNLHASIYGRPVV